MLTLPPFTPYLLLLLLTSAVCVCDVDKQTRPKTRAHNTTQVITTTIYLEGKTRWIFKSIPKKKPTRNSQPTNQPTQTKNHFSSSPKMIKTFLLVLVTIFSTLPNPYLLYLPQLIPSQCHLSVSFSSPAAAPTSSLTSASRCWPLSLAMSTPSTSNTST